MARGCEKDPKWQPGAKSDHPLAVTSLPHNPEKSAQVSESPGSPRQLKLGGAMRSGPGWREAAGSAGEATAYLGNNTLLLRNEVLPCALLGGKVCKRSAGGHLAGHKGWSWHQTTGKLRVKLGVYGFLT